MKVNSSRNPYVIPDVKGNDTLAIPCILIGGINVAGNGRFDQSGYEDSYGFTMAMIKMKEEFENEIDKLEDKLELEKLMGF
ncbi:hypothetical protein Tco_0198890 [Tanacetum coccineum]